MTSLLGFSLAVLLLGALALVPNRLNRLRLAAVVLCPLSVILVWAAVHQYQGWPVSVAQPPTGSIFVAASVDEPHAIYLWLIPRQKVSSNQSSGQPRAYRIPYSDQAYAQVLRAQQAQRRGETVTVQKARRGRRGGQHGSGQQVPAWTVRRWRLPPVSPPRKTP